MPLTQLAPPFPIFTDKNGDPLDAGYLYFGVVNLNPETNPIQVFFDADLTQPAAQPIRTINGYPSRNGSPSLIYANSQFSVTVRNKRNELVIYSPVGLGIVPGTAATNTDQMTYNQGSIGAVNRVLTSRLQDRVSVKDFGAVGDGVTDDTAAIQAAIDYAATVGADVFIPSGEYKIKNDAGVTAQGVNLKSNVVVCGEGAGSVLSAFSDNTNGYVIGAPRTETASAVTNWGLKDIKVVGPAALVGSRISSTVLIDWSVDVLLENVTAINGSDACIRVTGYGPGAFTNDILSPFWNNTFNVVIKNCSASNGYLGIEIEGGAENVLIDGCRVDDTILHGIRITSGYNVQCVNNTLTGIQGVGFWVDRHRDILLDGNYVECVGGGSSHCVSVAGFSATDPNDHGTVSTNVTITKNTLKSTSATSFVDDFQGSSDKNTTGVLISNNKVDGDITIINSKEFACVANSRFSTGFIGPWSGPSTGFVTDNLIPLRFNGAGYIKRAGNGGDISVFNNVDPSTFKPSRPLVQGGFVGVSSGVPTTGTWEAGHWVQSDDIDLLGLGLGKPFGYMCVLGGSPGTWVPIGQPVSEYTRDFFFRQNGNNVTRNLLTFTIPNDNLAIQVIVEGFVSRAPSSGIGTSRTFRKTIFFARNAGSNTVIDVGLIASDYEEDTTTAGGANNVSAVGVTGVIGSGGATDPQVINIQGTLTGFRFITAKMSVTSTTPLSEFGL